MKRYDANSPCPKCGCSSVSSRYMMDCIQRTCPRCGYVWSERPLDATEEAEK